MKTDLKVLTDLVTMAERFRSTPIVDDDFVSMKDAFDRELEDAHQHLKKERPTIVCLCGSTRFKLAFMEAARTESLAGKIVLTVGQFSHADKIDIGEDAKKRLDELHLRKIDMADEILVINVGKYVGDSTKREIDYAKSNGKRIRFLEA